MRLAAVGHSMPWARRRPVVSTAGYDICSVAAHADARKQSDGSAVTGAAAIGACSEAHLGSPEVREILHSRTPLEVDFEVHGSEVRS